MLDGYERRLGLSEAHPGRDRQNRVLHRSRPEGVLRQHHGARRGHTQFGGDRGSGEAIARLWDAAIFVTLRRIPSTPILADDADEHHVELPEAFGQGYGTWLQDVGGLYLVHMVVPDGRHLLPAAPAGDGRFPHRLTTPRRDNDFMISTPPTPHWFLARHRRCVKPGCIVLPSSSLGAMMASPKQAQGWVSAPSSYFGSTHGPILPELNRVKSRKPL